METFLQPLVSCMSMNGYIQAEKYISTWCIDVHKTIGHWGASMLLNIYKNYFINSIQIYICSSFLPW